jgi:type IV pilus assembly protein PilE
MRRSRGFTLIEVMITLAIVAILAAIAIPSYSEYVKRARITEAVAALADMHVKMERYFQDNRSYNPPGPAILPCNVGTVAPLPPASANFVFACGGLGAATYTVTATGIGAMLGFQYSLDQANNRVTVAVPPGWVANPACWTLKKDGSC